jgi:chitosanase
MADWITQAWQCSKKLAGPYNGGMHYCGDIPKAIYLKGKRGLYDKMEITCDGVRNVDGPCSKDPDRVGDTAFKEVAREKGWPDLDPSIHSYVVFGNDGDKATFDPQAVGMRPYSVVAVVCNNQVVRDNRTLFASLQRSQFEIGFFVFATYWNKAAANGWNYLQFYGIWGDTNRKVDTGIASSALGKFCFPEDHLTIDNGHGSRDIMYLGFIGDQAVPNWGRAYRAEWKTKSAEKFQKSLKALGERLISEL